MREDNRVLGRAQCVSEVTELRRRLEELEAALRESEERFRTLYEDTPLSHQSLDDNGCLLDVNQAWLDTLGYAREDVIGRWFGDFLTPESVSRFEQSSPRLQDTREVYRAELEMLRHDGMPIIVAFTGKPCRNERGDLTRTHCTLQDVTEQRKTEKTLRESEELHGITLDSILDAVFTTDDEGAFTFICANTDVIFGYSAEEVRAMGNISKLLGNNLFERDELEARGEVREVERIVTDKSGDVHLLLVNVKRASIKGGTVLYTCRDVSHRLRAEKEREGLEAQLRQAQKMEAIGQLAGGIAHDFNNHLQAIVGYTHMGMMGLTPEDRRYHDLEQVAKAADRAATLTLQLLTFSRRELLQPENIDLSVAEVDLMRMLRRVIGEHIELTFQAGDGPAVIYGDQSALSQVLMNLCLNARDAMPSGGTLTIRTERTVLDEGYCQRHPWATPGLYVLLSVADTGFGMSPDVVERVFEPFFTTKEAGKGTGLGLAMVYGIVKQHSGFIHATSEPGKGTTFRIYLPTADRSIEIPSATDRSSQAAGGTEVILLAEDDDMVRGIAVRVLQENGYTVLAAKDGAEAVQVFEENADHVDLALLDVVMPKLGGREAHDRIREIRPGIPVLFCSGYSNESIHSSLVLDEGLALLQKPYNPDDLLRALRATLDDS